MRLINEVVVFARALYYYVVGNLLLTLCRLERMPFSFCLNEARLGGRGGVDGDDRV